ncbi:MAG: transcriptional regulator [Methanosarcinales archaeon]|nr:MAG: transcriptional regulator [Methanosarcinales archaeon]
MKELLLHRVLDVLKRAGFITSEPCEVRPRCFDMVASRRHVLLLVKVLLNIGGLSMDSANEMRCLAERLHCSPLIVGERTCNKPLDNGVVYLRYGIPSINLQTLHDLFVFEIPPLIYAAPGGLYVNIDGDALQEARTSRGISLGEIASQLGVSRRAINKYEEGMNATIRVALKLESFLNMALSHPIDILHPRPYDTPSHSQKTISPVERAVFMMMIDIGFDVLPMVQAPFNALSQDKTATILTGVGKYGKHMIKRAKLMSSISDVTETQSVFIIEGTSKSLQIDNTTLVKRSELESMEDSDEFVTLIQSRKIEL